MKNRKFIKFLAIISIIYLIIGSSFLIYDILLLKGIETFYRIIGIILFFIVNFIIVKAIINSSFIKYKNKRFFILFIFTLLLSTIFLIISIMFYKAYNEINKMNKNILTYSSSLITLENKNLKINDLKNNKIGYLKDSENIEGNIIPKEIIKEYNLDSDNTIILYEDTIEMMNALINHKVDAIFISSNYDKMLGNIDEFKNYIDTINVITKKDKKIEKKKIEINNNNNNEKKLTDPFTLLILGVDSSKDGLNKFQSFNGDTILLISFDPETLNATMFSIPRDTYVPISCNNNRKNKINSAAYGGSSCMIKTIENFTDIKIDYYTKVNFKAVVELIDLLGGITVDVPIPDYPKEYCLEDSNRKYKAVCLKAGLQTLDGEHALALARVRKAFALGDFKRGQNQQLVVEAILNQIKSIRSAKDFYKILETISRNIDTNLSTEQILSFYDIGKKIISENKKNILNIQKTFIKGSDVNVYFPSYGSKLYTFQYSTRSLDAITNAIKINLGLKKIEPVKDIFFSINTPYKKTIIGDYESEESKNKTIPNFVGQSESYIKSWGKTNDIKINVSYVTKNESDYNKYYKVGYVTRQNVKSGSLLRKISSLSVVINKD